MSGTANHELAKAMIKDRQEGAIRCAPGRTNGLGLRDLWPYERTVCHRTLGVTSAHS